jgi:hypothetical protein
MVSFKMKCLLDIPQVLRTLSILIECTSFQKLYTGLSKRCGHGMLGLRHFSRAWVSDGECR